MGLCNDMLTQDGTAAYHTFCSCFRVAVFPLCLFLEVPWVDLWSVFVEFAGYTHLLFLFALLVLLL